MAPESQSLMDFMLRPQAWHLLGVLLSAIIGYFILVTIYRLTLHPLARYPGPFISKVSNWSIVHQVSTGERHLRTLEEHEHYGHVVRIAPNTLSINHPSALTAIYGSRKSNVVKSDWYLTIDAASGAESTHSEINRTKHAFRRRVVDQAFSPEALRSAEPFVIENIKLWCDLLGKPETSAVSEDERKQKSDGWTLPKNMKDWSNWLAYDIMGDLTFGKRFGCVDKGEHRYVPAMMMSSTKFVNLVSRIVSVQLGFLPFISLIRPLLGTPIMALFGGQSAKDNYNFAQYANSQIDSRINTYQESLKDESKPAISTRKDSFYYLLRARDPEDPSRGLSMTELHADSALLIGAGSDTVGVTIASSLFYLLHYPACLAKLASEIRSAFSSADEIRGGGGSKLNSLTYLRACIDEALRLAPPVPSHLLRKVLPGGLRIEIDGTEHVIPPGTIVGTAAYTIHRTAEFYPDPAKFMPERWIAGSKSSKEGITTTEESIALARSAFCPFSLGPRGCVGKIVGYMEVSSALASLLWHYDIRLPEAQTIAEGDNVKSGARTDNLPEYQLQDFFTADREGPLVEFRPRNN